MQTPLLRYTLLSAAIGSLLASPAQASVWNGSYVANGQCFCAGVLDSSIGTQLVPTPVGSQSIDQVCDRIGNGPELVKTEGIFNFPVYADPQCGHGPFSAGSAAEVSCSGSYAPGIDCQSAGPNWSLQVLYEKAPEVQEETTTTAAVTGGSHYVDPSSFRATDDSSSIATSGTLPEETDVSSYATLELAESVITEKVAPAAARVERADQLLAEKQQALEAERKIEWEQAIAPATSHQATEDAQLAEQARIEEAAKLVEQARIEEAAKLAEQARIDEATKLAEQARINEAAKLAEQARVAADAEKAVKSKDSATERSVQAVAETNNDSTSVAPIAALQLPAGVETNYNDFAYVQALPLGYDYGGSGMALSGSYSSLNKWHFVGRAGLADSYKEVFFGAGYYLTPPTATRLTVVATAGLEHGRFDISSGAISTTDSDTGLALSIASRFVVNHLVELQAGVGYSSFFDGDIHFLGGGFVHINKQLDLTSQFEIGDNDSFGLGIRYYY